MYAIIIFIIYFINNITIIVVKNIAQWYFQDRSRVFITKLTSSFSARIPIFYSNWYDLTQNRNQPCWALTECQFSMMKGGDKLE